MIPVELFVTVDELQVRVRFTEPKFYYFFVLEEREFTQGFLEVLHFAENLGEGLVIVKIEFGVEGVLGFESFQLKDGCLTYFVRGTFGLFRDFDLEIVVP